MYTHSDSRELRLLGPGGPPYNIECIYISTQIGRNKVSILVVVNRGGRNSSGIEVAFKTRTAIERLPRFRAPLAEHRRTDSTRSIKAIYQPQR